MEGYLSNMSQGQSYTSVGGQYIVGKGEGQVQSATNVLHDQHNSVSDEMLSELKAGDTFQGEIMSVNGQEVQLQLLNGQYLTAKLEAQMQLALGQILHFQVQSNQNARIVLKPLYTNLLQQQVGEAALKAANLAVNDKNLQMVSQMIENGLAIDKNSLGKFYRQVLQHPQASTESIIHLQKLQVPITDSNLTQYDQYKNLEYRLLDGVKEVAEDICRLYDTLPGRDTPAGTLTMPDVLQQALRYMDKILDFISGESQGAGEIPANQSAGQVPDTMQISENGEKADASQIVQNEQSEITLYMEQVKQQSEHLSIQGNTRPTISFTLQTQENEMVNQPLKTSVAENESGKNGQMILPSNDKPFTAENLEQLLQEKNVSATDVKKYLANLPIEDKDKVYRSQVFRKFLGSELQKLWTISPEEIGQEGKVEQFYRRLAQQSSRMSQLMNEAAGNDTSATRSVQNVRENVEFINALNQTFQYVQLPLKFSNSQAHGELYVYTNKRSLAKKEGVLTALLHLDMEHLGAMDIHISLETEKNLITTKFYLDENVMNFMQEHMGELTERLESAGYSSKVYVEAHKSEETVLEKVEKQFAGSAVPLSYQAFDIRT